MMTMQRERKASNHEENLGKEVSHHRGREASDSKVIERFSTTSRYVYCLTICWKNIQINLLHAVAKVLTETKRKLTEIETETETEKEKQQQKNRDRDGDRETDTEMRKICAASTIMKNQQEDKTPNLRGRKSEESTKVKSTPKTNHPSFFSFFYFTLCCCLYHLRRQLSIFFFSLSLFVV